MLAMPFRPSTATNGRAVRLRFVKIDSLDLQPVDMLAAVAALAVGILPEADLAVAADMADEEDMAVAMVAVEDMVAEVMVVLLLLHHMKVVVLLQLLRIPSPTMHPLAGSAVRQSTSEM